MWVIYAYCNHCGSEYSDLIFLAYIRTTASGDHLRCIDCGKEIHQFEREDNEV